MVAVACKLGTLSVSPVVGGVAWRGRSAGTARHGSRRVWFGSNKWVAAQRRAAARPRLLVLAKKNKSEPADGRPAVSVAAGPFALFAQAHQSAVHLSI